jgi:hypothetical protein
MTPWETYRTANPLLIEMQEYNTRVRDRVALKKARIPTAPRPQDEVQDRTSGPEVFGSAKFKFTDRYQAMGLPYPDVETMCKGDCEGTGLVPIYGDNYKGEGKVRPTYSPSARNDAYQHLWNEAEKREPTDDGWHLVRCFDCGGTGTAKIESFIADLRGLLS